MRYINTRDYDHKQADKIGILITNLGTPDEPTPKALKRYLKQFLSDPRVVEVPRLLWWLILNGVILQIRPRRSAKAYATVTGEPETAAEKILDKYRQEYRVSIEDFAEQVNAYIDQQGPNFRLNFFVDEVGQYIAENVKLI